MTFSFLELCKLLLAIYQNFSKIVVLYTIILKPTKSSGMSTTKELKLSNGKVVNAASDKKLLKNIEKLLKSKKTFKP